MRVPKIVVDFSDVKKVFDKLVKEEKQRQKQAKMREKSLRKSFEGTKKTQRSARKRRGS